MVVFFVGGKVVARHEEKAHRFLFPSNQEDKLREVVMTKGRRYEASLFSFEHVKTCIPFGPSSNTILAVSVWLIYPLWSTNAIWMWYINLCT